MRGAVAAGEHGDLVVPATGALSALVSGLLVWLGHRLVGKAAFQTALNDGFAKLLGELRVELEEERQLKQDALFEVDQLRKEVVAMKQVQESLIHLLQRRGVLPELRHDIRMEQLKDIILLESRKE